MAEQQSVEAPRKAETSASERNLTDASTKSFNEAYSEILRSTGTDAQQRDKDGEDSSSQNRTTASQKASNQTAEKPEDKDKGLVSIAVDANDKTTSTYQGRKDLMSSMSTQPTADGKLISREYDAGRPDGLKRMVTSETKNGTTSIAKAFDPTKSANGLALEQVVTKNDGTKDGARETTRTFDAARNPDGLRSEQIKEEKGGSTLTNKTFSNHPNGIQTESISENKTDGTRTIFYQFASGNKVRIDKAGPDSKPRIQSFDPSGKPFGHEQQPDAVRDVPPKTAGKVSASTSNSTADGSAIKTSDAPKTSADVRSIKTAEVPTSKTPDAPANSKVSSMEIASGLRAGSYQYSQDPDGNLKSLDVTATEDGKPGEKVSVRKGEDGKWSVTNRDAKRIPGFDKAVVGPDGKIDGKFSVGEKGDLTFETKDTKEILRTDGDRENRDLKEYSRVIENGQTGKEGPKQYWDGYGSKNNPDDGWREGKAIKDATTGKIQIDFNTQLANHPSRMTRNGAADSFEVQFPNGFKFNVDNKDGKTTRTDPNGKTEVIAKSGEVLESKKAGVEEKKPGIQIINRGAPEEFVKDVQTSVDKLGQEALKALEANKTKIVVGNKLSDVMPKELMKGVNATPRGHLPGTTWNHLDGVYDQTTNTVYMAATRLNSEGKFAPGNRGAGVARHELGHALDRKLNFSQSSDFDKAFRDDISKLKPDEKMKMRYLLVEGGAGKSETFAEVFAGLNGSSANASETEMIMQNFTNTAKAIQERLSKLPK